MIGSVLERTKWIWRIVMVYSFESQPEQRLAIIERLEKLGVFFLAQSKLPTSRYTRIFSKSEVIDNCEDEEAIFHGMEELFNDPVFGKQKMHKTAIKNVSTCQRLN